MLGLRDPRLRRQGTLADHDLPESPASSCKSLGGIQGDHDPQERRCRLLTNLRTKAVNARSRRLIRATGRVLQSLVPWGGPSTLQSSWSVPGGHLRSTEAHASEPVSLISRPAQKAALKAICTGGFVETHRESGRPSEGSKKSGVIESGCDCWLLRSCALALDGLPA